MNCISFEYLGNVAGEGTMVQPYIHGRKPAVSIQGHTGSNFVTGKDRMM